MDTLLTQFGVLKIKNTLLEKFAQCNEGTCSNAEIINLLASFGAKYGVKGNLWHHYISYFLLTNQNIFSLACERRSMPNNTVSKLMLMDMQKLQTLFHSKLNAYGFNASEVEIIENCDFGAPNSYNQRIANIISTCATMLEGAKNPTDFMQVSAVFYEKYGVGELGLYRAFRISNKDENGAEQHPRIIPISNEDSRKLSDIVGYELQKKQVIENTEAFLAGKKANNVLLYGDGGTGKSSTIKALLGEYYDKGLRIIEVYKHQFAYLNDIMSEIKHRNERVIFYLDDLSFEDFEIEYKYFKAIIDGGMETRPSNALIYATSNRRHLIKETWSDRDDMQTNGDIHRSDTIQEKLSLVARFGLSIFYPSPNQAEYLNIVSELAKKNNISMPQDDLDRLALQWQQRGSGKSGRSAEQFIHSLMQHK